MGRKTRTKRYGKLIEIILSNRRFIGLRAELRDDSRSSLRSLPIANRNISFHPREKDEREEKNKKINLKPDKTLETPRKEKTFRKQN